MVAESMSEERPSLRKFDGILPWTGHGIFGPTVQWLGASGSLSSWRSPEISIPAEDVVEDVVEHAP